MTLEKSVSLRCPPWTREQVQLGVRTCDLCAVSRPGAEVNQSFAHGASLCGVCLERLARAVAQNAEEIERRDAEFAAKERVRTVYENRQKPKGRRTA